MRRIKHGADQRALGGSTARNTSGPELHVRVRRRRIAGASQNIAVNDADKFSRRHANRVTSQGRILDRGTVKTIRDLVNRVAAPEPANPECKPIGFWNAVEEGDVQLDQCFEIRRVDPLCLSSHRGIDRQVRKLEAAHIGGQISRPVGAGAIEDGVAIRGFDDGVVCPCACKRGLATNDCRRS